ncbi:MAG: ArsR/SmtB family transcription factor [Thermoplasmatota archaeon]
MKYNKGMMKEFTEQLLRLFSSKTRCKIIDMLKSGYDHPEDIADDLDMTRQAVDKHLLELHDWGLVERNAVFPPDGRPKIMYELTRECKQLIKVLDRIGDKYRRSMINRAEKEIEQFDIKLVEGEIAEKIYDKKIQEIKKRWDYDRLLDGLKNQDENN